MTGFDFTEEEALALGLLGLPSSMDDILSLDLAEQDEVCETVHNEMLGPGCDGHSLNAYGDVCWWIYSKISQAIDKDRGIDAKAVIKEHLARS